MKLLNSIRILLASASLASAAYATEYPTYRVRAQTIIDGDTGVFVITEGRNAGTKITVRLAGVDAPEVKKSRKTPGQPMGLDAKRFLEDQTDNRTLRLTVLRDDHKLLVGLLDYWMLDRKIVVNAEIVRAGYADIFEPTLVTVPLEHRTQIDSAHLEAEKARKGIWSLANRERPADYRKRLAAD